MTAAPSFTLGIEEEYLLVDRQSRDLVDNPPEDMIEQVKARIEADVMPEFLRSQIEVATKPVRTVAEAGAELRALRRAVAEVAAGHGLAPIAASTHPFARWQAQKHTARDRYETLARDMQTVARRLVICGMHVHVGIEDENLRIDLLNQVSYFLPHLLALSTSSPFWGGEDSGLMSYRVSVFDEVPRTGLPEHFASWGEYKRHVDVLVAAGLIEDGTKLWWDARPSSRFPTLEMRITDICTKLEHGLSIAALYVCLLRMLWRLRGMNQRWRVYANMLVNENRWRAQRYGLDEGLVDFGKGQIVPYADLLEEIIALVREDADALGCRAEVEATRAILAEGTSAHRQRQAFAAATAAGAARADALKAVVDGLIAETIA
ncbi:carboxylate-amine ligase [Oceanibaculum pacificum]|uniref:Putative glutamate--cysteine ligase 2 n=1 Tax=Oceanibaculum pacificum TaxID=580166 RepID=A0A154WGC2_9PROT|nr:carboxylate-amine ligase [Oceanibaculum pacificum]KZD12505.1 carboxylate--amine ligase [Oceanibaculum pacificum]